ncbi:MAG: serine protein kinase RIO [Candidatus Thermoplasmatota archaeon]|nr:serine protein kinase RIO [Candidatus Thermoplasmatota archaeon]
MAIDELVKVKRRIKTGEDRKVEAEVFDKQTLFALTKLISDRIVDEVEFPIATGKESNVFRARQAKNFLALKIYCTTTSIFKDLSKYVIGDPRFAGIKKKNLVFVWARKEYKNLQALSEIYVRVPAPITCRGNVLVMEYIGTERRPAPMLKDVKLKRPIKLFNALVGYLKKAYNDANLVHGDFSEYNVLIEGNEKPVIIDVGQAVVREHPLAEELLVRDVANIVSYFRKLGVNAEVNNIVKAIKNAGLKNT